MYCIHEVKTVKHIDDVNIEGNRSAMEGVQNVQQLNCENNFLNILTVFQLLV